MISRRRIELSDLTVTDHTFEGPRAGRTVPVTAGLIPGAVGFVSGPAVTLCRPNIQMADHRTAATLMGCSDGWLAGCC